MFANGVVALGVNHDVKAEDFEADLEGAVVGEVGAVVVDKVGLQRYQSFQDDVYYFQLEKVYVDPMLLQNIIDRLQGAFARLARCYVAFRDFKRLRVLIYSVVR